MTFAALTLLIGILISTISGYFSVVGMAAIFSALPIQIMIAIGSLEIGKICVASWLYRFWNTNNRWLRNLLCVFLVFLMSITSLGVFGFFSKAHFEQSLQSGTNALELNRLTEEIQTNESRIVAERDKITKLDAIVDALVQNSRISGPNGARAVRKGQDAERNQSTQTIDRLRFATATLRNQKLALSKQNYSIEIQTGPIKYLSRLIYGEDASSSNIEKSVIILIVFIVCIFDPLAITLIIAGNESIRTENKKTQEKRELTRKEWPHTTLDKIREIPEKREKSRENNQGNQIVTTQENPILEKTQENESAPPPERERKRHPSKFLFFSNKHNQ